MATPISTDRAVSHFMCVDLPLVNNEYMYLTTAWFDIPLDFHTYTRNPYLAQSLSWSDSLKRTSGTTSLLFSGHDVNFNNILFNTPLTGNNITVKIAVFNSGLGIIGSTTTFVGKVDTVSSSIEYTDDGAGSIRVSLNCISLLDYIDTIGCRTTTSKSDISIYSPNDKTYDYVDTEVGRNYTYTATS